MSKGKQRRDHRWITWRFGYVRCARCGLIWLKNARSERAARRACKEEGD